MKWIAFLLGSWALFYLRHFWFYENWGLLAFEAAVVVFCVWVFYREHKN